MRRETKPRPVEPEYSREVLAIYTMARVLMADVRCVQRAKLSRADRRLFDGVMAELAALTEERDE
jgi:hypothetical protein